MGRVMRLDGALPVVFLVFLTLNGCGGGGSVGGFQRSAVNAVLPINWDAGSTPARSAVITIKDSGSDGGTQSWTINRGTDSGPVTYDSPMTFMSGAILLQADFFSEADGRGTRISNARGIADLVSPPRPLPVIRAGGTFDAVWMPSSQTVPVNGSVPALLSASIGTDLIALPNSRLEWTIIEGTDIASVDAGGIIRGLRAGEAKIRASLDGETTGTTSLVVSTPVTPQVPPIIFFGEAGGAAPGNRTYLSVGESLVSKATIVGGKERDVIWSEDPLTAGALRVEALPSHADHPEARITAVRPSRSGWAGWRVRLRSDGAGSGATNSADIRIPFLGTWSVIDEQIITGKAGTGLDSLSVDRYYLLSNPASSGEALARFRYDGQSRSLQTVLSSGFELPRNVSRWGVAQFGGTTSTGISLSFDGTFPRADSYDFSLMRGNLTIGTYRAVVTLTRGGGGGDGGGDGGGGGTSISGSWRLTSIVKDARRLTCPGILDYTSPSGNPGRYLCGSNDVWSFASNGVLTITNTHPDAQTPTDTASWSQSGSTLTVTSWPYTSTLSVVRSGSTLKLTVTAASDTSAIGTTFEYAAI